MWQVQFKCEYKVNHCTSMFIVTYISLIWIKVMHYNIIGLLFRRFQTMIILKILGADIV